MTISPHTQAVLLLTSHFAKPQKGTVKPLTPTEWGRFAFWLKEQSLMPEHLMNGQLKELLRGWTDKTVTLERIEKLLNRGSALALSMEKWLRAGLWVVTRSDPDYPRRWKKRLRTDSPALLFGCGNKTLLNRGGLAVIGSRSATQQDLDYSRQLGQLAANSGSSIVSGGARGVDETTMLGALDADGTVVGVLANGLLQACSSSKYRDHLMANNLVLVSTFSPEAGFNVGNAMQRNKYIYCLSDAAVVVHSGRRGGTWTGAMENLRKQWVPLWVKQTRDEEAGNASIVAKGAQWLSENIADVDWQALFSITDSAGQPAGDWFGPSVEKLGEFDAEYSSIHQHEPKPQPTGPDESQAASLALVGPQAQPAKTLETQNEGRSSVQSIEFYDLFLEKLRVLCAESPKSVDQLVMALQLQKSQVNIWLKQAVADKKLKKLTRPVRYQWLPEKQGTLPI